MGIEFNNEVRGLPLLLWRPPPEPDPSPFDRCCLCGIYRILSALVFVGWYEDGERPHFDCVDRYACVRRGDLMKADR